MNHRGIDIPLVRMGAVTSEDLFEEREQEIFDLYERNWFRYRSAADVGANVGVHTIIMAKLGWSVLSFEPDPNHFAILRGNVERNNVQSRVILYQNALSDSAREVEFVRVLGNTTASHIKGSRDHHGLTETIKVQAIEGMPYFESVDFAKVDVEGHEAELLCTVPPGCECDFLVEIGTEENAEMIFNHFQAIGREMWAQRSGWGSVTSLSDVPKHYKEGALFIGRKPL